MFISLRESVQYKSTCLCNVFDALIKITLCTTYILYLQKYFERLIRIIQFTVKEKKIIYNQVFYLPDPTLQQTFFVILILNFLIPEDLKM